MEEGNTLVNAVVGAVVTGILTWFVPFAPLFGGGLAGYAEGGDRSDGLRVGGLSGVIASVPILLIAALIVVGLGVISVGAEGFFPFAIGGIFVVFAFFFAVLYVVGLSALGGWLGNYVKYDTDFEF